MHMSPALCMIASAPHKHLTVLLLFFRVGALPHYETTYVIDSFNYGCQMVEKSAKKKATSARFFELD